MNRAPVQGTWSYTRERGVHCNGVGSIEWAEHEQIWSIYATKYDNSQSAVQIAERGGFGYDEIISLTGKHPKTWTEERVGRFS